MSIQIQAIPAFKDNYLWLLINDQSEAVVVDPGDGAAVLQVLQEKHLTLLGILITHKHHDHVGGIALLKRYYTIPVYGNKIEEIPDITHFVSGNDVIAIPHFPDMCVINVPGHTLGHLAYLMNEHLFCGDTLFGAGCGRLFEGTVEQMFLSLQTIKTLPDTTKIYCAHEYTLHNLAFALMIEPDNEYIKKRIIATKILLDKNCPSLPSTLALEKNTNPFLRCNQPTIQQSVEKFANEALHHDEKLVFKYLREWRNQW